jgi:hypothetical protein
VASAVIIETEAAPAVDQAPSASRRKGPFLIAGAGMVALLGAGGTSYALHRTTRPSEDLREKSPAKIAPGKNCRVLFL